MAPESASLQRTFNKSVGIAVSGGRAADSVASTQISDEDLVVAVEMAIRRTGLFSKTFRSPSGDYQLDLRIVKLKQPLMGLDMTVSAQIEWRLKRTRGGKPIWQETIDTEHTAKLGEAFVGVERLSLATEGAVRKNIQTGLEHLSRQSL